MKILICSDIHGDLDSIKKVLDAYRRERAEKLIILGDLLYHGPRNDLPETYAPKAVIELLNESRESILTVKGNCDGEVDQMVLNFPILADYAYLVIDGLNIFVTHGHHHNTKTPPPLKKGDILLHGHTHIPACQEFGCSNYYLNPGSVSIPKGGYAKTYMIYDNRCFTVKDFEGKIIFAKQF